MGKLDRLMAKKESLELDLGNNEKLTLEIRGLSFPELAKFAKFADSKDYEGALQYLLFSSLRRAMPRKEIDTENGYTDEELKAVIELMDGSSAMKIVNKVQELSGLLSKGGKTEEQTQSSFQ